MAFIQIIEFVTDRPEAVDALVDEWSTKTAGRRSVVRGTFTEDRDQPGTYVQIVEFPSYEEAMANSALPETAEFAERLSALAGGPLAFRNLEVRSTADL